MQIVNEDGEWIIRVPTQVVEVLGLEHGLRVTLRPVPQEHEELRYFTAAMRDKLPDYPFDHEDWNGVDVQPQGEPSNVPRFAWSSKPVPA